MVSQMRARSAVVDVDGVVSSGSVLFLLGGGERERDDSTAYRNQTEHKNTDTERREGQLALVCQRNRNWTNTSW